MDTLKKGQIGPKSIIVYKKVKQPEFEILRFILGIEAGKKCKISVQFI